MFTRLTKNVTYRAESGRVYNFAVGAVINLGKYPGIEKLLEDEKEVKKSPSDKMVRADEVKTK